MISRTTPVDSLVEALASRSAGVRVLLESHLRENFGGLLPHLFLGALTRHVVELYSQATQSNRSAAGELASLLGVLEEHFSSGVPELQELIAVSFLENLPSKGESNCEIRELLGPSLAKQVAEMTDWRSDR